MKKFCVFCGLNPESKNKEHIIPQWLIKKTGDLNRQINLGIDTRHFKDTGKHKVRTFSFKSFQFPACEKCNSEFAVMEGQVKDLFDRIFEKDYFNNTEIDLLLDWFDKVRIGLWLGSISLDDHVDLVSPKYHIKQRISHRDRCLLIYELKQTSWKGIQFIGFNSPGFQFIPSCFSLRVNNIYFFNYSYDFLFSKNIGFPYPIKIDFDDDSRLMQFELHNGTNKIHMPLLNQQLLRASTYIYQPIIPKEIFGTHLEEMYNTKYVQENCLNYKLGKGHIFYYENGLTILDDETELQLYSGSQNYNVDTFPYQIANQTFKTTEYLLTTKPHANMSNQEHKKGMEENRLAILKAHRNFMKINQKDNR